MSNILMVNIPSNFTGKHEFCGDKHWYKDGVLHREDGPAIEMTNGDKYWYINGMLHREDGPAVEYTFRVEWWYEGKKGLENFPAELKNKFTRKFIHDDGS